MQLAALAGEAVRFDATVDAGNKTFALKQLQASCPAKASLHLKGASLPNGPSTTPRPHACTGSRHRCRASTRCAGGGAGCSLTRAAKCFDVVKSNLGAVHHLHIGYPSTVTCGIDWIETRVSRTTQVLQQQLRSGSWSLG